MLKLTESYASGVRDSELPRDLEGRLRGICELSSVEVLRGRRLPFVHRRWASVVARITHWWHT